MNLIESIVSPQAMAIYNLLNEGGSKTAAEIGVALGILPNAVYRSIKQLEGVGILRRSSTYPVVFSVITPASAMGWFLLEAQRSFKQTFGDNSQAGPFNNPAASIAVIKSRTNLLKRTDQDAIHATRSINFIVSGLEVPDATILAYRKAIAKGVRVRALVQQNHHTTTQKLEQWKDIGVDVRYQRNTDLRIFTFDNDVAYITSYNDAKKEDAFGIRFNYPPLATMLNGLFEQQWHEAMPL
jgi:sugar-specific transcriptional regulator TrmB